MDPQLAKLMKQRRRRAGGSSSGASGSSDDNNDDDNDDDNDSANDHHPHHPHPHDGAEDAVVSLASESRTINSRNRNSSNSSSNNNKNSSSSTKSRPAPPRRLQSRGGGDVQQQQQQQQQRTRQSLTQPPSRRISSSSRSGGSRSSLDNDDEDDDDDDDHDDDDDDDEEQATKESRERRRQQRRRHHRREVAANEEEEENTTSSQRQQQQQLQEETNDRSNDEEAPNQQQHATAVNFDAAAFGVTSNAFEDDGTAGFGAFPADFGAFPAVTATTTTTSGSAGGHDDMMDLFGGGGGGGGRGGGVFSAMMHNMEAEEYQPPSFGHTAPLAKLYDKSPIDQPPVNNVESAATKIKFISPHPVLMQSFNNNKGGGGGGGGGKKTTTATTLLPPPVANPLTGHLILCRNDGHNGNNSTNTNFMLSEWNAHTKAQAMCTPILTVDVQRKVATKFGVTATAVDAVLTVTVGLHASTAHAPRARVAALVDLTVMEQKEVLRVVAIWQWGYGGGADQMTTTTSSSSGIDALQHHHPIQLQSVLSPPSGSDFSYNTQSLLLADSCVFVSGASAKGPCVFLSKPTVRETWSANFVGKDSSARIAHMAVTACPRRGPTDPSTTSSTSQQLDNNGNSDEERLPYLAIALTDGTLSVWTYEAATKLTAKTTETVRRLLFPLCRLEATRLIKSCPVTPWSVKEQPPQDVGGDVGYCTHLQWVTPRGSSYNQLLMLAASFQGALCLYHVALPKVVQDGSSSGSSKRSMYVDIKAPTEKTTLHQTVSLQPFCLSKWPTVHHHASVSFVDLGPHVPPSLALLMTGLEENLDYARLALLTCPLQGYVAGTKKGPTDRLAFYVWDSHEWTKNLSHLPRGLIPASYNTRGILYHSDSSIQEIEYRTNTRFPVMSGGVGSVPLGLTTAGTNHSVDAISPHKSGVLTVYTTYHCERQKTSPSSDSSSSSSPVLLEWTTPTRRHWLIETFAGDCKDATPLSTGSGTTATNFREATNGDDDVVLGGTHSKVVCELVMGPKLAKHIPYRIVRNPFSTGGGKQQVAVWFRRLLAISDEEMLGIVEEEDERGFSVVQLLDGRDVVFLPNQDAESPIHTEGVDTPEGNTDNGRTVPQALLVSRNGGSVSLWQRKGVGGALKSPWQEAVGMSCRPLLGIDEESGTIKEGFVELRQFVTILFQDQIGLVAVGSKSNGKYCLIIGPLVPQEGLIWSSLLPNIEENPVLWLNDREQVTLVLPLPSEGAIRGGLAVATTYRILIVSPDLKILASVSHAPAPSSLAPLGSYTVAYCSHADHKLRYLSGLPEKFGRMGVIASFPRPVYNYCPHFLIGVRPDRFLYNPFHHGTRLVERGQPSDSFLLPMAFTRPALLLEPMIANAIATGGDSTGQQPFLRSVVEKFGRKVATMSHGEDEGIGSLGAGMTPRVFELLEYYNLKPAASWLLTGTVHFDRLSNSRVLPPWMPALAKVKGALDTDTHLHVASNGDQYFTEYVKSPDTNMSSTLPRPSHPAPLLCRQFGIDAIKSAEYADAVKMLDVAGTESADALILQLSLAYQMDHSMDVAPILNSLFETDSQRSKISNSTTISSLAALATELKKSSTVSQDFQKTWMRTLAPSFQRCRQRGRHRALLIGESALSKVGAKPHVRGQLFSRECPESKLVWNEGPNREKANLLMLDHIQDWFGRRRPVVLGKEGARSADDRGASTLADILNTGDDDSFGAENDNDFKDGWVDGVGEGLKDEDKLSAYFRFSEGEDEDAAWRDEGFSDITRFDNTAIIVGCGDTAVLQESTSSIDEGESGKVKALYDLVFEQSGVGQPVGLAIPARRGGSLDIGMMHGPDHLSRQKCTIEFWFWVPESITKEVVLIRRTFGSVADDLDTVCTASDKSTSLWELGLNKSGEMVFRTIAGKFIKTEPKPKSDDDEDDSPRSTVVFSRWNHVCITIKQESITHCAVTIFSKGVKKASSDSLSFSPPGFEVDDFSGASALDPMLEKSYLVYGLDHPKGFRLTELRTWAMERNDDDIRTLMTEYLECAEIKRKFKVKIKKAGGGGDKGSGGFGLAPPKTDGLSQPSDGRATASPRRLMSPPGALKPPGEGGRPSLRKRLLAPPKGATEGDLQKPETPSSGQRVEDFGFGGGFGQSSSAASTPASFGGDAFGHGTPSSFGSELQGEKLRLDTPESMDSRFEQGVADYPMPEISPLWDSAIPLSEQVRSSAAAALIRGPPATRHFGGNRGGLPDYRELERFGVGSISICGSEKTIVWRDDQVPPGLTYPIGASGAIVSDQMDEEGSEFLCCFLAKDKRMVVFELSTRTVVVELQMTTKLNYWRFLPPEAGEDTLCFMLVTPVGGFHWMPLDESPRPRQVWKRGAELQGKKIVSYEEGGTNGLDGPDMLSKVGLLLVTNAATGGRLEAWIVPICGDSQAVCASDHILGACLCQPPEVGYEAWVPLLLFVVESDEDLVVCVSSVTEVGEKSVGMTEVMTDALIELGPYQNMDYEPPTLAMGTYPEVLCCSLGSTIVIIIRRKGLVVAYELAETGLELVAQECVGHYVVDAVMRYSAVEGGAEIVLLMSDEARKRDGRVGTFSFRAAD